MTQSNYVIGDTPEDLNREHKVTLTEGQISTILYIMEGYINPSDDYSYDPDFREDVDNIFERLEGVIDTFYDVRKCIIEGNDYADCVDTLVERMNPLNVTYPDVNYRELTPFEEEIEIQKYIRENDD
tara:strand:+ start:161 stop:541 length:381 start_codon:yes stop_codon:yes gene_type:complete